MLIRGRERRIPLHYALMKGQVDVVKELILAGVGSIKMVTSRGETALHLAVKSNKFDVLKVLIEHIESSHNLGDVRNKKDESLTLLLKRSPESNSGIEVNSLNEVGCTALDVLLVPSEVGDIEIEHLIRQGGGLRAIDLSRQPSGMNSYPRRTLLKLFKAPRPGLPRPAKVRGSRSSTEDRNFFLLSGCVLVLQRARLSYFSAHDQYPHSRIPTKIGAASADDDILHDIPGEQAIHFT
ncbi:UNVERIFIED_CONTAM: hypothetical protein Sindi_1164500 [Sesamum indicum]